MLIFCVLLFLGIYLYGKRPRTKEGVIHEVAKKLRGNLFVVNLENTQFSAMLIGYNLKEESWIFITNDYAQAFVEHTSPNDVVLTFRSRPFFYVKFTEVEEQATKYLNYKPGFF